MLFSNGNLVCTGVKSIDDAEKAVKSIINQLTKKKFKVNTNPKIKTEKMIVSYKFKDKMDLDWINKKLQSENVEYFPDEFPGLIYKKNDPDVTVLLFNSGKAIFTGSNLENISAVFENLTNKISSNIS